jgi:DNA-binding XRE family transcriptional regulator
MENSRHVWDYLASPIPGKFQFKCSLFENIPHHHAHVNTVPMITRLGEKVKRLRKQFRMTQTVLAQKAELKSRGYISDIEQGNKIPPTKLVVKLAEILQVTPDYLLLDDLDTPEDKADPL